MTTAAGDLVRKDREATSASSPETPEPIEGRGDTSKAWCGTSESYRHAREGLAPGSHSGDRREVRTRRSRSQQCTVSQKWTRRTKPRKALGLFNFRCLTRTCWRLVPNEQIPHWHRPNARSIKVGCRNLRLLNDLRHRVHDLLPRYRRSGSTGAAMVHTRIERSGEGRRSMLLLSQTARMDRIRARGRRQRIGGSGKLRTADGALESMESLRARTAERAARKA